MLHLSIKTSKKVNNFKKHQRLKDHYNWVWPTLVAPRQALATQWVALVTVCWKITSGFGANLRKFWIETLFPTSANPLEFNSSWSVGNRGYLDSLGKKCSNSWWTIVGVRSQLWYTTLLMQELVGYIAQGVDFKAERVSCIFPWRKSYRMTLQGMVSWSSR